MDGLRINKIRPPQVVLLNGAQIKAYNQRAHDLRLDSMRAMSNTQLRAVRPQQIESM